MTEYIYYNVTFYKDMHPHTGLGLPVIEKEVIGKNFVRVRPAPVTSDKEKWSMPEMKRAQWQATKLARCQPEMGNHVNKSEKWVTVEEGISCERRFFYHGEDGLYDYTIYLVKADIVDTRFTP